MLVLFWICIGLVFYTYILYPILIFTISRLRPQKTVTVQSPLRATVVVVVRNEADRMPARILNLRQQEPAEIVDEIIVVSDGSDDGTNKIIEELQKSDPRIRLISLSKTQGKAAGVNAGVEAARNEIIVFADARQDFRPDTVARLLSRFSDPQVGAVAGELRFKTIDTKGHVAESVGLYWKYEVWIRRCEALVDSVIGCPGAVYAARRGLFRPMPIGTILDDVWVPMHVVIQGKRVAYEADAIAEDMPSHDLDREFKRKVRTLAGNIQLVTAQPRLLSPIHNRLWWMFVSHKLMRLVVPYAMLGALATNVAMPDIGFGVPLVGQLAFYSLGIAGLAIDGHRKVCRLCVTIKVFLSINFAAMIGTAFALTGRSHLLWIQPSRSKDS